MRCYFTINIKRWKCSYTKIYPNGGYNLHIIEYRDLIIKEIDKNRDNFERDIKILENNNKEYEKDLNYLKEEVYIVKKPMRSLSVQDESEIDDFIDFLLNWGKK